MWYFSWILGLGLALAFGILNAMWLEVLESQPLPDSTRREGENGEQSLAWEAGFDSRDENGYRF